MFLLEDLDLLAEAGTIDRLSVGVFAVKSVTLVVRWEKHICVTIAISFSEVKDVKGDSICN